MFVLVWLFVFIHFYLHQQSNSSYTGTVENNNNKCNNNNDNTEVNVDESGNVRWLKLTVPVTAGENSESVSLYARFLPYLYYCYFVVCMLL